MPETKPLLKRDVSLRDAFQALAVKRRGGRHRDVVGLKIGSTQLAAAKIANNGAAELVQLAREPLPAGVVTGGEVREPAALAAALGELFAKHKLPRRNVRLGISSNRVGVRTFDLPDVADPKQLANAIRFRAQEALPIPLDQAVLDYQLLEEADAAAGTPGRVLLVVTYRELVQRYVEACRIAGIELLGVDLEAFALLRALSAPRRDGDAPDAAVVAIAIGHERSTVAVSDGKTCEFTRVIEWGGANLSVAVARALDLAPSEAEAIKHSISLTDGSESAGDQADRATEAIRGELSTFARELVASLQFYQNQPGSLGIGEVIVTGGTTQLGGVAEELQRLVGVAVRVGDPLARVRVGKKVDTNGSTGSLAVAIGLGIED